MLTSYNKTLIATTTHFKSIFKRNSQYHAVFIQLQKMSMAKTLQTNSTNNKNFAFKNKDIEELFLVDDSFDDSFGDENAGGSQHISSTKLANPQLKKQYVTISSDEFGDIDDAELIDLTSPKKTKNNTTTPTKLNLQPESDDEMVFLTTPTKLKQQLINHIDSDDEMVLLTTPRKLKQQQVSNQATKKLQFLNNDNDDDFSADNDLTDDDEKIVLTTSKVQKVDNKSPDPLELSSSWNFSSSINERDELKQLENQKEFEEALKNNHLNNNYKPLLEAPVPKLILQSSRLTNSSNLVDTSPVWHRHETWLNVAKSSPQIKSKTRTPVLNLSSSPPNVEQEEEEESVRPISRMVQKTKASDIARRMIEMRSPSEMVPKRLISTTVPASGKPLHSKNSLIELFTQPNLIENDSSSLRTTKHLEKNVKPVILSSEQLKVVEILKQGQSLFYTGSAGTGKSILLRSLIKTLRTQHGFDCVGVTASTGLALCNIGGSTLHSFAGIGLGNGDVKSLIKKIKRSKKNLKKWKFLKVLIIDEISMIDGELLDKLNVIGKELRKSNKPFGGIQLIVCGDFYQLPPVAKEKPLQFAFECKAWKEAIDVTIILQKVFRQQGDTKFIDMLNDLRCGEITADSIYEFQSLSRPLNNDDGIDATELFPTRQEVDRANSERLNKIKEPVVQFNAFDTGSIQDPEALQRLLNNFLAPRTLHLKKGAQVMMIKNIDETLVNGSLGKVLDFIDPDTYMFYERASSTGEIEVNDLLNRIESTKKFETQSTKSVTAEYLNEENNSGLDENIFDFFKNIELDQGNELLSQDIERKKLLIETLHNSSKLRRLPLVRFSLLSGETRDILIEPETFEVEDPQNEHKPMASRKQLPLILAWALSIHKSQGQTLTKTKVNLQRVFEKGQAYVALSRATSREGLQILNFNPAKIMAHARVIEFYKSLVSVDDLEMDKLANKRDRLSDSDDFEEDDEKESKRQRHSVGAYE